MNLGGSRVGYAVVSAPQVAVASGCRTRGRPWSREDPRQADQALQGAQKGVTMILKDVYVDAKEYTEKITGKGGVMDMMRRKMW